jgi:phytoene dehydrogenase-like protein
MREGQGSIVIVGAGINGLVAANYLQRGGYRVTLLERKAKVGGACTAEITRYRGATITYPPGASVLGMMQRFVFKETGLADEVDIRSPRCPEIVYFAGEEPFLFPDNDGDLAAQVKARWGENGHVLAFLEDLERVAAFLRAGYRRGVLPTLHDAEQKLGRDLVALWITGSARNLLDHYLTSDRMKIFFAISITESGPVSLDAPYSAFTLPVMTSGGVFGGKWGFVKGGIWNLTRALHRINTRLGVRTITAARATAVSPAAHTVRFRKNAETREVSADTVVFATDPLSAAKLIRDRALIDKISSQQLQGSSGKLVMIFKRPVRWKGDNGRRDFHAAFRYVVLNNTLEAFERSSQAPRRGVDFSPGFLEIYCEGPAMEMMGLRRKFHIISVFFKDLGFGKAGKDLPRVREQVSNWVCEHIENSGDLIKTILETPKDIARKFYFPMGNIDHTELTGGQTFFKRTYSRQPDRSFYQFGDHESVFYCGAGSYPCGSVAGTPGYMCAKQILRRTT